MGFGKAFLVSLAAFVGLNFAFIILNFAVVELFNVSIIQRAPLMILYFLFGSITVVPFVNLDTALPIDFFDTTFSIETNIILGIGFIIAPLAAAILAGRLGESKIQSFGAWALTAVISTVLTIVGSLLSDSFRTTLAESYGWVSITILQVITMISMSGLISIVFYGFFALLLTRPEYY